MNFELLNFHSSTVNPQIKTSLLCSYYLVYFPGDFKKLAGVFVLRKRNCVYLFVYCTVLFFDRIYW